VRRDSDRSGLRGGARRARRPALQALNARTASGPGRGHRQQESARDMPSGPAPEAGIFSPRPPRGTEGLGFSIATTGGTDQDVAYEARHRRRARSAGLQ